VVSGAAVLVWAVCGALVALLAIYAVGQKAIIASVTHQIKQKESDLEAMPDLIPAMTAQQHVTSLSSLYKKRVYLTKFFEIYSEATPVDVTISSVAISEDGLLTASGTAPSYAEAAKVSRALAACNVKVCQNANSNNSPYFTNVTLSASGSSNKTGITFSINASVAAEVTSK
jgi:hypothetical protein